MNTISGSKSTGQSAGAKIAFAAMIGILCANFIHGEATFYRSSCRTAIQSENEANDVSFACRFTSHPEKDSYWIDWIPFATHERQEYVSGEDPVSLHYAWMVRAQR
jgi:hypothetical protein